MRWWTAALLLAALPAQGQWRELTWVDPGERWRTLDTAHFSVHFAEGQRAAARAVAAAAERIYPGVSELLGWRVEEAIHLLVLDSSDFANGFASPLPFNYSGIFLAPPDEGELLQNRDWLDLVLAHELFHIVHLDKAHGRPDSLRRIFGRFPLLFPNALQPRWIVEGLAVYAESLSGARQGRLGQSYYEGMMRAEVARGLRSLSEVNAEGRGFPLNREYLYGAYFFAFLRERYGTQAIRRYVEQYSASLVPFKLDSTAEQATGKSMQALWDEYHAWLRERFAPLRAQAVEGEVVARGFALLSPVLAPDGTRWYVEADGYVSPKLMRQDGGVARRVRDIEHDTRLALDADGSLLLAQPEICRNYRLYFDLHRASADGGWERLTRCGRFRFAAPLAGGRIAALRFENGIGEVVELDRRGTVQRSLYRAAAGEALTGLAAQGESVVFTSQRSGRWSLVELRGGTATLLLSDAAVKHSPRFAENGDELYFVADYGNVYEVWSLRRRDGGLSRWTRAAHGVREISAPHGGEMLLTTIEADGDALRVYRLPEQPLERRSAELASSFEPQGAEAPLPGGTERRYSPWPSLRPHAWFPFVSIADGAVELGIVTTGQDALGLHRYVLAPRYELTQDEALGELDYVYDGRHGARLERHLTVKGEASGDITAYTIQESAQWISTWRELSLNRRWYWGFGGALERERLHEAGRTAAPLQDERVLGLVAGFDSRRERWLSEGPSEGQQLRLFAETSNGLGGAYSGNVYRVDGRVYLPLGKTVFALRWNEAYGDADAEPFQLGGTRSDEGLALLPVLNEREFALRGYTSGEPALTGHRARVVTLEWRLPLADVDRHRLTPPVGVNRMALNLFGDIGAAWDRRERPDYHRGIGAELMAELRFGYIIGLHARAGIARGVDEPGRSTAYLELGRSF